MQRVFEQVEDRPMSEKITYVWRGTFTGPEADALHAAGFDGGPAGRDRVARMRRHSLGWVCARDAAGVLVGFVNVAWDGDAHAFLLDTVVDAGRRRAGIATRLVALATAEARAAGCAWLHVDFEDHLRDFYLDACGFRPTAAGLIAL
jgi:ribosomal protein S18 acetylase RimI-like enzyme